MLVKDLIELLQNLPLEKEVMGYWDGCDWIIYSVTLDSETDKVKIDVSEY